MRANQESFNAYSQWLGIPVREQPPDHYVLLGVPRFSTNVAEIEAAADERMKMLRSFHSGKRYQESERLLNDVAEARICLLDQESRKSYDIQLRSRLKALALRPLPGNGELISKKDLPDKSPDHIERSIPKDPLAWLRPWETKRLVPERFEKWILPTIFGLLSVALLVAALLLRNSS